MDYILDTYKLIIALLGINFFKYIKHVFRLLNDYDVIELENYYVNISYMTAIDGSHSQLNQTLVP